MLLEQLLALGASGALYEYDFGEAGCTGSCWRPGALRTTTVLRRGRLEDPGRLAGYEEIVGALANPSAPSPRRTRRMGDRRDGSDERFDPAALDLTAVNLALAKLFPVRRLGETLPMVPGKGPLRVLPHLPQKADNEDSVN